MNLKPGLYRHYKGNDYYVFQVVRHSETREALVVYQCLYGDYSWWVRPLSMFTETVELAGEIIPRFAFVEEISAAEAPSWKNKVAVDLMTDDQQLIDEKYMRRAIELAGQAEQLGEVPVGAVIVCDGDVIGEGFNRPITSNDPTAHAEIIALRQAAEKLQNYRVVNSTLYVTLEPCTMCVGALIHSRISRLVFGTTEPKAGAVISQACLLDASYFNHRMVSQGGVLADQCQHQLSDFFRRRREELKKRKASQDNCESADEGLNKKNDR